MKKLFIALAVIIAIGAGLYFYAYKGHRDIASEEADFTVSVKQLQSEFSSNAASSTVRYADKTLSISGKVTSIDRATATVMLDNVLSATFSHGFPEFTEGQDVIIKSRFVGYDDLLEELRTDQASISQ